LTASVIVCDHKEHPKLKFGEIKVGKDGNQFKMYPCHKAQLKVIKSSRINKYTAMIAGSGAGKTILIPLIVYLHLSDHRKKSKDLFRGLIISPTNSIFKSSSLEYHLLNMFKDTPFEGTWKSGENIYYIPQANAEIVVRTAEDDPKRISGGQYNGVICFDEAWIAASGTHGSEIFEEVRRRSNIHNCPVVILSTPNVNGFLYDELMLPYLNGDKNYYVVQCKTSDNPVKTPEQHAKFLDNERIKLGTNRFLRMYCGEFATLSGLIYECMSDPRNPLWPVVPTLSRMPSPIIRSVGGLDHGWQHPACALMAVEDENGILWIVEEIYGSHIEVDRFGPLLRQMESKWSNRYDSKYKDIQGGQFSGFFADVSRPETIALISRNVQIQGKRIKDVDATIAITDQLFRCGRLKIFDCCKNLIAELKRYYRNDNGKPPDVFQDAADALRYLCSSHFHGREITPNISPLPIQPDIETIQRLSLAESEEQIIQQRFNDQLKKAQDWQQKMLTMDPYEDT